MINLPPILTIAGSDSSGGAGIQADLKTIQELGGYGMSVITALTAQNTLGVQDVFPIPAAFVAKQITAVLEDIPPAAIKTGMLANAEIIKAVADNLAPFQEGSVKLIVDPVMVAKGGARLLEGAAVEVLKTKLLPLATLVTPNIPEAEVLADMSIHSLEGMETAANKILTLGANAVLIKGGHLDSRDEVHNLLLTQAGEKHIFTSPRIDTKHTHGTGCTLSAAIATYMGLGETLADACAKAETYVAGAIQHAPGIGHGHGPLNHGWE